MEEAVVVGGGGGADKELQYKLDFQQFVNARISFSIVVVVVLLLLPFLFLQSGALSEHLKHFNYPK